MTLLPRIVPLAVLLLTGCLKGETLDVPKRECQCYGLRCLDGKVARLRPDDEELACIGCRVDELGACALGCGPSKAPISGCTVAALCRTWERASEGAACATDFDCEPGPLVDGTTDVVRLRCSAGACVRADDKWGSATLPAQTCKGPPEFGPHPACDGAPCMPIDELHSRSMCASARCIDDRDCPALWRCRCAEEPT
ncbi:MAG: hypothetical protein ACK4N5_08545, partial [Myxococcales bacterium]